METIVFIIFSLAFLTCPVFFWQVPVAGPKAWPWGQICDGTLRPETDGQRSSAESNFMVEWSSSFWPGLLDLFRSPKNRGKSCRFPWPIQCRSNDIILPLFKGMKHAVRHSARCSICKSCKIQYGFVQKLSIYICIYIIHNGNILYYDTPICNHVNIYIIYSTLHTYIYIVPYIYIYICVYIYTHIHDFMTQLFRLYHHKSHKIWLVYNLPIFRITSQCRKAEKPRICSSSFQTWRSLSVLSSLFIQNMGVNIGYPKIVIWWSKCRSTIKIFDILF
jgi:hypothetical protein